MTDSEAEVIDHLTAAVGYRPHESLVVLPFCEHDEAPLVLCELPDLPGPVLARRFSTEVTAAVRQEPWAEWMILVLYTGQPFGDPQRPVHYAFVEEICARLHRAGLHLRGAFCVAHDGWGRYEFRPEHRGGLCRRPLRELDPTYFSAG